MLTHRMVAHLEHILIHKLGDIIAECSSSTSRHVQHERTAHRQVAGSPWKPHDKLSSPEAYLILLQKSSTCQAVTSTERTACHAMPRLQLLAR